MFFRETRRNTLGEGRGSPQKALKYNLKQAIRGDPSFGVPANQPQKATPKPPWANGPRGKKDISLRGRSGNLKTDRPKQKKNFSFGFCFFLGGEPFLGSIKKISCSFSGAGDSGSWPRPGQASARNLERATREGLLHVASKALRKDCDPRHHDQHRHGGAEQPPQIDPYNPPAPFLGGFLKAFPPLLGSFEAANQGTAA